ncbi:hypothetical protein BJV77DRAFT_966402 [Russula vinacea]|nr:hypothetical protein BJV77DRAFT_966402 [Russula vinacea]
MVAEQEVKGLLCEDVPVCGHPGEEAPDRVFGGEILRHACTEVVQGVMVSIENGFEPPGVVSDVFETPRARMGCKSTLAIKRDRRECMGSESGRSNGCGREKGCRVDAVVKREKKSGTLAR